VESLFIKLLYMGVLTTGVSSVDPESAKKRMRHITVKIDITEAEY
jgi:hypothetical protein